VQLDLTWRLFSLNKNSLQEGTVTRRVNFRTRHEIVLELLLFQKPISCQANCSLMRPLHLRWACSMLREPDVPLLRSAPEKLNYPIEVSNFSVTNNTIGGEIKWATNENTNNWTWESLNKKWKSTHTNNQWNMDHTEVLKNRSIAHCQIRSNNEHIGAAFTDRELYLWFESAGLLSNFWIKLISKISAWTSVQDTVKY